MKKDKYMVEMNHDNIFQLLENQSYAHIFWNLLVEKELTAKQISRKLNKDISTILRSLNKLEKEKIVSISRSEAIRNFKLNYWTLSQEVLSADLSSINKAIMEYLSSENPDQQLKNTITKILRTVSGIIISILHHKINEIISNKESALNWISDEILSINLLDKEKGKMFQEELMKFLMDFMKKHNPNQIPIKEINQEGYIFFLLTSQISNTLGK